MNRAEAVAMTLAMTSVPVIALACIGVTWPIAAWAGGWAALIAAGRHA